MKKILTAIILAAVLFSAQTASSKLTDHEFVPPLRTPKEHRPDFLAVKTPEAVRTQPDPSMNRPVTRAASVQDAINTIVQRHEEGCEMIAVPEGGYGFVATGLGTYRTDIQNITALRLAQRNAYVQAFMQAKNQMAGQVRGIAVSGFTNFDQSLYTADNETSGMNALESSSSDSIRSSVAAVLKGFVTYDVFDDSKNGMVYVTIVSTPKTRGAFSRVVGGIISAKDINEGIESVLAEIHCGLVPLVGGRVVEDPATGELAFVGFGSAVVRQEKNPAMRSQRVRAAQASAKLRAQDSLCGIIVGDMTRGEARLDELTRESVKSYVSAEAGDPMNEAAASGDIADAEKWQNEFRNSTRFSQTIQSARKGTLPPGVSIHAWTDDDGVFAYAVAVYRLSMTKAAVQAGEDSAGTVEQSL